MDKTKSAVWTTKFINNLPDAAFAVIEPGGKKDKEGKTVPRSLRHLPHHNANVKSPTENSSVDLVHLRNALARAPQMKIAANLKQRAIGHLNAHAKELLKTRKKETAHAIFNEEDIQNLIVSLADVIGDDYEKV